MLPVMKALKHGLLINLFLRAPWCAASKAVQIIEAQEKLLRVLHPVDTEFKFVHVMRVKMNSRLSMSRSLVSRFVLCFFLHRSFAFVVALAFVALHRVSIRTL